MTIKIKHTFNKKVGPVDLEVTAQYTPPRPPPPCSDPDSPAFSDPGDPSEFTILAVSDGNGGAYRSFMWNHADFYEKVGEALDKEWESR